MECSLRSLLFESPAAELSSLGSQPIPLSRRRLVYRQGQVNARRADIVWGVRQALSLTAIVLIPAAIASVRSDRREVQSFLSIAAAYLAFGAMVGVLLGVARRRLAQKRTAIAVGAVVGGVGLTILMSFADPRGAPQAWLLTVGALLGLLVGACLGWWMWKRAGAWKVR